jgi:lactoylglutathione lyase
MTMRYLHTMVRVSNVEQSLDFFANKLGLKEVRRTESQQGRFTLIFLAADENPDAQVELTYNWDPEIYTGRRNFGHLAYSVANIYDTCQQLQDKGVTINRPPRDGRMAFVKSPDGISIELLNRHGALPPAEPWKSMPNTGTW